MKIKTLIKGLVLTLLAQVSHAQEYLELRQDDVIYDVEVIVFARNLAQPELEAVKNPASIKVDEVLQLMPWDEQSELMIYPPAQAVSNESEEPWEVPIEDTVDNVQVLSWIILGNDLEHPIVDRLNANPIYQPIYRQLWRQPSSDFTDPTYVAVSSVPAEEINEDELFSNDQTNSLDVVVYDDFSIDGQVAFSEQRFTHLHVKMNFYRQNINGEQLNYQISQQKRIELNEWQYFDHQQFGVLAKVTEVSLVPGSEE